MVGQKTIWPSLFEMGSTLGISYGMAETLIPQPGLAQKGLGVSSAQLVTIRSDVLLALLPETKDQGEAPRLGNDIGSAANPYLLEAVLRGSRGEDKPLYAPSKKGKFNVHSFHEVLISYNTTRPFLGREYGKTKPMLGY